MNVTYRPGPWLLVVLDGLALCTPDEKLARRAWELIDGGAGAVDLLHELVRDGFAGLAEFVLVDPAGSGARVLVRGGADAQVDTPIDTAIGTDRTTSRWTGVGVTTWAERSFARVSDIRVETGSPVGTDDEVLPLRAGLVRCGGFGCRPEGPLDRPADPAPPADPRPDPVATPVAAADLAQTRTDDPDDGFDHLFESTIIRSVEDAAIREVVEDGPEAGSPIGVPLADVVAGPPVTLHVPPVDDSAPGSLGDHDGHTITSGDLGGLREQTPNTEPVTTTPAKGSDAARLELSTGDVVVLDRDVVIGRRPQVDRVQGGLLPTVVTVPSPQQDVSRTHLRIERSGAAVLATDLHSMNGTVLLGADGTSRTLDGGSPHPLADGDTLDIGDGVTLTLRLT